ncbi:MAG: tetratricopeptide repeat protein [bacterium]
MKSFRWVPLLCGLLLASFTLGAVPDAADARRSKSKSASKRKLRKQAKRLFRRAQRHYRLGRFVKARALYEKAYDVLPLAGFLYNIAQCFRMEKNYDRAVYFYKSYLSEKPDAKHRGMVEKLIQRCEKAAAREKQRTRREAEARRKAQEELRRMKLAARLRAQLAARPQPQPFLPPKEPKKSITKKWWFWTSIAGGVVAIVAAGVAIGLSSKTTTVPPEGSLGFLDRR